MELGSFLLRNNSIIEIFGLANDDRRTVCLVVTLDRGFVGRTPIDRDLLGHSAMTTDRFRQKPLGRLLIAVLGEEKVDRLAVFVDGTIEIVPHTLHFDVRLVEAPAHPHRPLPSMERFFQLGAIFDHPSINGGVIHL